MQDPPPYHLEIDGLEGPVTSQDGTRSMRGRPWLGIHFDCCHVYSRIYRNTAGTQYRGRCPRCLRAIRLSIGSGGTDARFFIAE